MTTTSVGSSAELIQALGTAQAGDTVALRVGTYTGVNLSNYSFATAVNIVSADPLHQATISDLKIWNSTGLNFKNLEFSTVGKSDNPFQILSSQNVNFDHLNVHGSMDNNDANDVAAFFVRNSSGVTFTNSEFQQLQHGIGSLDSDHLTITGNDFHDLREDGIRGGGNSWVTISRNSFTNFHPNIPAGDHPDAIQFWTVGTKIAAHDIVITENLIDRGTGGSFQGIFLKDELGTLHYEHVTISGNLVVGGAWNGITVQGGKFLEIDNNTLSSFADQASRIRIEDSQHVTLMHNIAQEYINDRNSDVVLVGNKTSGVPSDLGASVENAWSETHQVFNLHKLSAVTPIAAVVSTPYNDFFQTWTAPDGSQPILPSVSWVWAHVRDVFFF